MYYGYGYGYGMGFDPLYLLIILSCIVAFAAQMKVQSTYSRYSRVNAMIGMTGAQVARRILDMNGLQGVRIEHVRGNLTDHYDPRARVLRLSDSVYDSPSIAAIGVAAHECGHAIQHEEGYMPLSIRNGIFPVVNFASRASWVFIFLGFLFSAGSILIKIGIIMFSLTVLFQLITLPVEFDASSRALRILSDSGMLYNEENAGARKVLTAAAMTYVAAAITAVLQLLRLIALFGRRSDD